VLLSSGRGARMGVPRHPPQWLTAAMLLVHLPRAEWATTPVYPSYRQPRCRRYALLPDNVDTASHSLASEPISNSRIHRLSSR
jgi:hypothetical protein